MSNYTVIAEVSKALRNILWKAFSGDGVTQRIMGSSDGAIVFSNPTEAARDSANRLSLWLYRVTENEYVKNQPMRRASTGNAEQFPPLALNLYYLLTPFATSVESDHLLLGKAMTTLYDHATTVLVEPESGIAEELHIVLCRLTLEEFTRIWEARMEPYRLSVCYEVRVTRLDSLRIPANARVVERSAGFGDVPPEVAEV
jgi:hypothetical protein